MVWAKKYNEQTVLQDAYNLIGGIKAHPNVFIDFFFCVKYFAAFLAHVLSSSCLRGTFSFYHLTQI